MKDEKVRFFAWGFTNVTFICQMKANYKSFGGDNGSPVYSRVAINGTTSTFLAGIHWGTDTDGEKIFSSFDSIVADLSPMTVF